MFIADNSIFKSIMQNFLSQINSAEGVLPNDEFWKKNHFTVFKISVKCNFDGQTLIKCDFLESRLLKYFFQEMCSFGGKQTIHKVSAAFADCQELPSSNILKGINNKLYTAVRRETFKKFLR